MTIEGLGIYLIFIIIAGIFCGVIGCVGVGWLSVSLKLKKQNSLVMKEELYLSNFSEENIHYITKKKFLRKNGWMYR